MLSFHGQCFLLFWKLPISPFEAVVSQIIIQPGTVLEKIPPNNRPDNFLFLYQIPDIFSVIGKVCFALWFQRIKSVIGWS